MQKKIIGLLIIFLMMTVILAGCIGPGDRPKGGDETPGSLGISWADMVPIKKTMFVGYDSESYLDDYAYLAAVPASTFYSSESEKIYSTNLRWILPMTKCGCLIPTRV